MLEIQYRGFECQCIFLRDAVRFEAVRKHPYAILVFKVPYATKNHEAHRARRWRQLMSMVDAWLDGEE